MADGAPLEAPLEPTGVTLLLQTVVGTVRGVPHRAESTAGKVLQLYPGHQLTEAGYTIVQDEIGRPGLSLADVKAWRETARRAEVAAARRDADFVEHQAATRRWVAGRDEAARAAHRRARDASRTSPGMALAAGQDAGTRAAEEYERTVPRPLFDGRAGTPLNFITEDEAGTLSGRVKATARRLVGLEESVR